MNRMTKQEKIDLEIARKVFSNLLRFSKNRGCEGDGRNRYSKMYIEQILKFVRQGKAIEFVLPAFPAKSPNRKKTLGALPDKGEELALEYLTELADKIKSFYSPGIQIMIASDGRVFSEVVEVSLEDVEQYSQRLKEWVEFNKYDSLFSFYDLDDALPLGDSDFKRNELLRLYGQDLVEIKEKVKKYENEKSLFNGLHRFMFEDIAHKYLSRSQARKAAKVKAYQLLRLSNAWSEYLKSAFPGKVRLSIHPHELKSGKLSIKLSADDNGWGTPWHRVALKTQAGFSLVKKHIADKLGARLVYKNKRPYYYALI